MSKLIRSPRGRLALLTLLFCGVAISVAFQLRAQAAPYVNPFWTNGSSSQESAIDMVADRAIVCESGNAKAAGSRLSVDVRTGELFYDLFLFSTPGVVEDNVFALRWRSMISGSTQMGNGMIGSWETTANYVLLNAGAPNGPSGHRVDIRRPSGRVDAFLWNGTAYVAPADVFDTLTTVSGLYRLTDKWGNRIDFDTRGMPATYTDRNGNADAATYNALYQMTGYTDDRGKSYTTSQNLNGYMSALTDFASRSWGFGYDMSDNLTNVTTPATADQPSGIGIALGYDGNNRLTSVTDGRSHTVWAIAYSGATGQVSSVTIDGHAISYSITAGTSTDRTDRNGGVHRYYFTGKKITRTCMDRRKRPGEAGAGAADVEFRYMRFGGSLTNIWTLSVNAPSESEISSLTSPYCTSATAISSPPRSWPDSTCTGISHGAYAVRSAIAAQPL